MLEYKKGEAIKFIDESSKLISILEGDGWELVSKSKTIKEGVAPKIKKLNNDDLQKID